MLEIIAFFFRFLTETELIQKATVSRRWLQATKTEAARRVGCADLEASYDNLCIRAAWHTLNTSHAYQWRKVHHSIRKMDLSSLHQYLVGFLVGSETPLVGSGNPLVGSGTTTRGAEEAQCLRLPKRKLVDAVPLKSRIVYFAPNGGFIFTRSWTRDTSHWLCAPASGFHPVLIPASVTAEAKSYCIHRQFLVVEKTGHTLASYCLVPIPDDSNLPESEHEWKEGMIGDSDESECRESTEFAKRTESRFRFVMTDEMQDCRLYSETMESFNVTREKGCTSDSLTMNDDGKFVIRTHRTRPPSDLFTDPAQPDPGFADWLRSRSGCTTPLYLARPLHSARSGSTNSPLRRDATSTNVFMICFDRDSRGSLSNTRSVLVANWEGPQGRAKIFVDGREGTPSSFEFPQTLWSSFERSDHLTMDEAAIVCDREDTINILNIPRRRIDSFELSRQTSCSAFCVVFLVNRFLYSVVAID